MPHRGLPRRYDRELLRRRTDADVIRICETEIADSLKAVLSVDPELTLIPIVKFDEPRRLVCAATTKQPRTSSFVLASRA